MGSVDTDNFRVYKRFSIFSFPFQLLADENIPTCAVCEIVVKGLGVIRFEGVEYVTYSGKVVIMSLNVLRKIGNVHSTLLRSVQNCRILLRNQEKYLNGSHLSIVVKLKSSSLAVAQFIFCNPPVCI